MQTAAPVANWNSVSCSADGTQIAAAAKGGSIYVSTNSGLSWIQTGAPVADWHAIVSSGDGRTLAAQDVTNGIYMSTNGGGSWQLLSIPGLVQYFAMSADGTKLAVSWADRPLAQSGLIFISTNSGQTWTSKSCNDAPSWIAFSGDGSTLARVAVSAIQLSSDLAETWDNTGAPGRHYRALAVSSDASTILAAGSAILDLGLFFSTDRGRTWGAANVPQAVWITAVSADGRKMAALGSWEGQSFYASEDAGATWVQGPSLPAIANGLALSADGNKAIAAAADGIYVLQTPREPRLDIAPSGATVTVSWPATPTPCTLQQSGSPATGLWSEVDEQPAFNSNNQHYEVSLPLGLGQMFYRLVAK